jgi:hypothetical protein
MHAQATTMSRAGRRRAQRQLEKSKFTPHERQALCERFVQAGVAGAAQLDPLALSDKELISIRRLLEQAQREAERAYEAQQRTNDLPFSDPANFPRIAMVFEPVERILDEQETNGYIDCDAHGLPLLFSQNEGIWYPAVPAFVSMCDTYTKLAGTHGWSDETDGMRKFAKRLELSMPIFQQDVDRARGTIEWMKKQTLTITPNQSSVEVQEIRIRDEFRAVGVLPS